MNRVCKYFANYNSISTNTNDTNDIRIIGNM